MNLIVCVDKNNGILFNNRRVSRDSKIIDDIKEQVKSNKIICSHYSKDLFSKKDINLKIINNVEDINESLEINSYYFLEDKKYIDCKYNVIIIYNFNRAYPSDIKFNYSLDKYILTNSYEFIGTSHDKITKNIYVRGDINEISY